MNEKMLKEFKSDLIRLSNYKNIRVPTHTKYGWLIYILALVLLSPILKIFNGGILNAFLSILQIGIVIALIVEIVAILSGKNKREDLESTQSVNQKIMGFIFWIKNRKPIDLVGDFIGGIILTFVISGGQISELSRNPSVNPILVLLIILLGGIFGGLLKAQMTYEYQNKKKKDKAKSDSTKN